MRFHSTLIFALTLFLVCSGLVGAQNNNEADKKKRRAEIQKEINELQERLAKLTAELAKLQSTEVRVPKSTEEVEGRIYELEGAKEPPRVLSFSMRASERSATQIIQLGPDTQIMFSDGQKANESDLKIGQRVSVRASQATMSFLTSPPKYPRRGYVVVITKAKDGVP